LTYIKVILPQMRKAAPSLKVKKAHRLTSNDGLFSLD
jgi:hypothetical protein